jgi:hypothetical protein
MTRSFVWSVSPAANQLEHLHWVAGGTRLGPTEWYLFKLKGVRHEVLFIRPAGGRCG